MYKCITDGGQCGLGGYCDRCPYTGETMNNQQQLMQIRDKHHLSYNQIAKITGCSWYSVKAWLLHSGSKAYRGVSDQSINKLITYLGR